VVIGPDENIFHSLADRRYPKEGSEYERGIEQFIADLLEPENALRAPRRVLHVVIETDQCPLLAHVFDFSESRFDDF
jgi:hypothetical protein